MMIMLFSSTPIKKQETRELFCDVSYYSTDLLVCCLSETENHCLYGGDKDATWFYIEKDKYPLRYSILKKTEDI